MNENDYDSSRINNKELSSTSITGNQQQDRIIPIGSVGCAVSNRRSLTEGISPTTNRQQLSSATKISPDSISIAGAENHSTIPFEAVEDRNQSHQLVHYGSTSTTFSTGSSNITSNSFGTTCLSHDQSSITSSSGVATMSSTDNLLLMSPLSRNSGDDSTPTISTLTEGGKTAELKKDLEPFLTGAASTMSDTIAAITSTNNIVDVTAGTLCNLSLTTTTSNYVTNSMKDMTSTFEDPTTLLTSHTQAQSTPLLQWCGKDVVKPYTKSKEYSDDIESSSTSSVHIPMKTSQAKKSKIKKKTKTSGSKQTDSIKLKPTQRSSDASLSTVNLDASSTIMKTTDLMLPSSSPSSSHSLLGSSPLPSVFNCAATSCSQIICTPLRTIVSQNRRRYQMDGFNLDLTYITDRIIAMGYPADTKEALYRNSMSHIVKFLEHYHPGHYKVFNLRGQYVYDPANFHNRVVSFEMTDHHPPRLELMAPFCREVHDYLNSDPLNVVAVHCKAGKGRTGVMICAYLCYIAFYKTPRQNMDYYSIIRTHNNKGVTIPSQRRYVYYFAHLRERNLNYMPLRCELIGVYLERPPKLSGTFSKGALKVRVACGDVDVFLGEDMWINDHIIEEEEELHKRYPLMAKSHNNDKYGVPHSSDDNCVSRRCYGWTVPENKRVFLEGDIRMDIFQKSRLKLFNVKQERKKIGHIWFNTMFTCPGFCGGQYIHGDEAYPYPDSMIVKRRFVRKQKNSRSITTNTVDNSQSTASPRLGSHPTSPLTAHFPASAPTIVYDDSLSSDNEGSKRKISQQTKNESIRHNERKLANGSIRNTTREFLKSSPIRSLTESQQRGSQNSESTQQDKRFIMEKQTSTRKQCRSSLDTAENEYDDEIVVEKPPNLDRHCPPESLLAIYPNEKMAPRYGIEEMIREAFNKNLINDLYNVRRMSQPTDGPLVPKAPIARPNANGPACLIQKSDEHVVEFGVQEIDRAYKNKDIDPAFKIFILTRCIDESNPIDVRLAEQFINITYQKQAQKDTQKILKMQQKHRKLIQQQNINANLLLEAEKKKENIHNPIPCSTSSITNIDRSQQISDKIRNSSPSSETTYHQRFIDDPRFNDPLLNKYFFRQRITSHSRHPNIHHHCSLRPPDPKNCSKYGCARARTNITEVFQNRTVTLHSVTPSVSDQETRGNGEKTIKSKADDDNSFDDFDFFHPRQNTCSTVKGESNVAICDASKNKINENQVMHTIQSHSCSEDVPLIDHQPAEDDREEQSSVTSVVITQAQLQSKSAITGKNGKDLNPTEPVHSLSDFSELEVYHPSDCSLASTSSSCSSDI